MEINSLQLGHKEAREKLAGTSQSSLSFLLVGVTRPENLASIIRLADAVAAKELFLDLTSFDAYRNKKPQINRMARIEYNSVSFVSSLNNLLSEFLGRSFCIEITTTSTSVFEVAPPNGEILLVVGSERHGIPDDVLMLCPRHLHVPMYGKNSSMNVSAALAVTAYTFIHAQIRK